MLTFSYFNDFLDYCVVGPTRDTYPNNFKCFVYLKDRQSGKTIKRRGYGKFIGNFSPIWIRLGNKMFQLTEVKRMVNTLPNR